MRLNRFLASAGLGSRRSVEKLITDGQVRLNGKTCTDLATLVGPEDRVEAEGRIIESQTKLTVMLNKPPGTLVTASDEKGRATVFDLLPAGWPRLTYVGRLDKESEGLLLLTNDGDLVHQLTHPSFKVEKEYEVVTKQVLNSEHLPKLIKGVFIMPDETTKRMVRARAVAYERLGPNKLLLTLEQGLKRQIRLMLARLGYEVKTLKRIRTGSLKLGRTPRGEYKILSPKELALVVKNPTRQVGPK